MKDRHSLEASLLIALSVLAPAALIRWLIAPSRLELGLGCAPFGWQIVMIVHMVAAIPIGLVTASEFVRPFRSRSRRASRVASIILGLGVATAVAWWGESVAAALAFSQAGFLARDLARTMVAFLLVFPWLVAAPLGEAPGIKMTASPVVILVGATIALLPPLAFATRLIETHSSELTANLKSGRLIKAEASLIGLGELLGSRPTGVRSRVPGLQELRLLIARMERDATREIRESDPPSTKLERAFLLIQLDRLEEAEAMLLSISGTSSDALLLLGSVYRDQSRWSDSEWAYRRAITSLVANSPGTRESQERITTAFDGLAESARRDGHPEKTEQAYLDARRTLPAKAAYFALQLGRHYLNVGRPSAGMEQLQQAVQFDPALRPQVQSLLSQAQLRTPSCLMRFPGPSVASASATTLD